MSATTHARYRATEEQRFRQLLSAWLTTLPPDGWKGGVTELFAALDTFGRAGKFFVFVPTSSGLTKTLLAHDTTIRAGGFSLRIGRTKSARFIAIEPSSPRNRNG
ncbi:MAG: hypothetical protein L0241_26360 [Planctomycetia bacterium]|nr:hypothetical protein [Planctomycetia bacterium]